MGIRHVTATQEGGQIRGRGVIGEKRMRFE